MAAGEGRRDVRDALPGGRTACPADGRLLASCAEATREDVDDAVNAAWAAWESWKNVAPAERAAILMKVADAIDANKEHLAMVESLDNGKPIRETLNVDVPMSADHFRYFAGAVRVEEGSAAMLDGNTLSLHALSDTARADRRRRAGRAVELPVPHGGVEARAGARRRLLHRI